MDTLNLVHNVGTAALTGDDSNATLFIIIMVVMAVIIIAMVVFSVVMHFKHKTTIEVIPPEGFKPRGEEDKDNKDDTK